MIGNNELKINEATMMEAMQLWLNDNFKVPPKVVSVSESKTGTYSKEFTIATCSQTEEGGK
jgi:hypothetical protein